MSKSSSTISVRGARTHNLKNIDVDIPRDKLTVITGLSGSGKSSLAFDTLYAEGQRRYVESLSAYARQFLSMMDKPDVDLIEGLSPAISIEQKTTLHNPRSTVGTITEIYDYLRLLFARAGEPRCPTHKVPLSALSISDMVDTVMQLPSDTRLMVLAPVVSQRKGEHVHVFADLIAQGFVRARIDGIVTTLDHPPTLDRNKKHSIDVVVDRIVVREGIEQRLADTFETTLRLTDDIAVIAPMDDAEWPEQVFSARFGCPHCNYSVSELQPRMFSFNNPMGACNECDGLGRENRFDPRLLVVDVTLTLAEGAVVGWDRGSRWNWAIIEGLAKLFQVDIELPYDALPQQFIDALFQGVEEKIPIVLDWRRGRRTRKIRFPGVLQVLENRYRQTVSSSVREKLQKFMSATACVKCNGSRLREESRNVFIDEKSIADFTAMSIAEALQSFQSLQLTGKRAVIAEKVQKEIQARLSFLVNVGLNYLTLDRSANSLSGGEGQRIRLASQIGAGLVGVMYILDEPSIGLHQRDNERLLSTLTNLRDLGNTVIVVEHDEEAIRTADHIVDMGPKAGIHGGEVVVQGSHSKVRNSKRSLTAQYLTGRQKIDVPKERTPNNSSKQLVLNGLTGNNLKDVQIMIPIGLFTCVTGVSGSGKSTLINHTLYPIAARELNRSTRVVPAPYDEIFGLEELDKVIDIDQSPIGRTPRSNPATYTGLFTAIRDLFTKTQESRVRGYAPGRFSFNVKGGRCEACQGDGLIKVEMHFLPDVYVSCDVCNGMRYNRETLEIRYKGKNIHEVLDMTVEEALDFFHAIPFIKQKLQTLSDVGLTYIRLGQSATTLSGGEAQRVKLSKELSKRDTGNTLYILDEPTTGLHFHDIKLLLGVLTRLRDQGNTVVVIEHNLDVIKTADWIIDLGPEGGEQGGEVVTAGTPETVARCETSHTGRSLRKVLEVELNSENLRAAG